MRIHWRVLGIILFFIAISSGDGRASLPQGDLNTALVQARQWLVAQQQPDGSWVDGNTALFRSTSAVISALQKTGGANDAIERAAFALSSNTPKNVLENSVGLSSMLAAESLRQQSIDDAVQALFEYQKAETRESLSAMSPYSGWGLNQDYHREAEATALAIKALSQGYEHLDAAQRARLQQAARSLIGDLASQSHGISWSAAGALGQHQDLGGSLAVTSAALTALKRASAAGVSIDQGLVFLEGGAFNVDLDATIQGAARWLLDAESASGTGWGTAQQGVPTKYETALALIALVANGNVVPDLEVAVVEEAAQVLLDDLLQLQPNDSRSLIEIAVMTEALASWRLPNCELVAAQADTSGRTAACIGANLGVGSYYCYDQPIVLDLSFVLSATPNVVSDTVALEASVVHSRFPGTRQTNQQIVSSQDGQGSITFNPPAEGWQPGTWIADCWIQRSDRFLESNPNDNFIQIVFEVRDTRQADIAVLGVSFDCFKDGADNCRGDGPIAFTLEIGHGPQSERDLGDLNLSFRPVFTGSGTGAHLTRRVTNFTTSSTRQLIFVLDPDNPEDIPLLSNPLELFWEINSRRDLIESTYANNTSALLSIDLNLSLGRTEVNYKFEEPVRNIDPVTGLDQEITISEFVIAECRESDLEECEAIPGGEIYAYRVFPDEWNRPDELIEGYPLTTGPPFGGVDVSLPLGLPVRYGENRYRFEIVPDASLIVGDNLSDNVITRTIEVRRSGDVDLLFSTDFFAPNWDGLLSSLGSKAGNWATTNTELASGYIALNCAPGAIPELGVVDFNFVLEECIACDELLQDNYPASDFQEVLAGLTDTDFSPVFTYRDLAGAADRNETIWTDAGSLACPDCTCDAQGDGLLSYALVRQADAVAPDSLIGIYRLRSRINPSQRIEEFRSDLPGGDPYLNNEIAEFLFVLPYTDLQVDPGDAVYDSDSDAFRIRVHNRAFGDLNCQLQFTENPGDVTVSLYSKSRNDFQSNGDPRLQTLSTPPVGTLDLGAPLRSYTIPGEDWQRASSTELFYDITAYVADLGSAGEIENLVVVIDPEDSLNERNGRFSALFESEFYPENGLPFCRDENRLGNNGVLIEYDDLQLNAGLVQSEYRPELSDSSQLTLENGEPFSIFIQAERGGFSSADTSIQADVVVEVYDETLGGENPWRELAREAVALSNEHPIQPLLFDNLRLQNENEAEEKACPLRVSILPANADEDLFSDNNTTEFEILVLPPFDLIATENISGINALVVGDSVRR